MKPIVYPIIRVLLILFVGLSGVQAAEMAVFDLRGAEFAAPADWDITYRSRDQEYDFESPDKRFQLWARWWFQDEPLLATMISGAMRPDNWPVKRRCSSKSRLKAPARWKSPFLTRMKKTRFSCFS